MFHLDDRQSQAAVEQALGQLEEANAALAQAQIDVRRYTPLVQQKAVSQAELDKASSRQRAATAQVAAAQAVLDNAKLNLTWTTVVSPISGIPGIAKVGIGDLMTPNTIMATVSAVDPIYVDFSIAEQDYLRFRSRQNRTRSRPGVDSGERHGLPTTGSLAACESRNRLAHRHDSSTCRVSESYECSASRTVRAHTREDRDKKECLVDSAEGHCGVAGDLPGRSR